MVNRHDEKLAAKASARGTTLFLLSVFVLGVSIATAVWWSPIEPIAFTAKPLPDVKWDDRLTGAVSIPMPISGPAALAFKKYEGVSDVLEGVDGEEAQAPKNGNYMYASGQDGTVVEVELATGQSKVLVNVSDQGKYLAAGYKCGDLKEVEYICGRSMGMAFDQDNLRLYVLNAYRGLYSIDVQAKTITKMSEEDEDGQKYKFLYGLAVSRHTGIVYFTEALTTNSRAYMRAGVLEGAPNGRLLSFNPTDGTVRLLASKMYFPTGVLIQENKDGSADEAVLVAETSRARIRRIPIWKDLNKKASPSTFSENLPGLPMSLQWADSSRKEIIVGCEARTSWLDSLSKYPHARAFLATIQGWVFDLFLPRKGIVLRLDNKGALIGKALQSGPASVSLTSAQVFEGSLYLANDGWDVASIAKLDKFK